ncbi:MAG: oligoendopeptidase F, partial [Caldisericia bacterium]|nr:oligoendopeptidase F [Caldisericia bacterium]
MNHTWDLSQLYQSFQATDFIHDWETLEQEIQQYSDWLSNQCKTHEHEIEFLKEYIRRTEKLYLKIGRIGGMIHLSMAANSKDKEARDFSVGFHKVLNKLTPAATRMTKWVGRCTELQKKLDSDEELNNFSYYFTHMQEEDKHSLSETEEVLLSMLSNNGSSAWSKLAGDMLSSLTCSIEKNGKIHEIPIGVVRNMAYSKIHEERRRGYEAELIAYKKIDQPTSACLNSLKGEYIDITEKRKYASPLDRSLKTHRISEKTVTTLLKTVEEFLPAFEKFNMYKAKKLGYANGLPFYELNASINEQNPKTYTFEEAKKLVLEVFASFDHELLEMGKQAFSERWIDVEPRKGKRNGAFCSGCASIKQSRILLNFNGSLDNIFTIAHELGHAFHNKQMFKESSLLQKAPMPLAETASIFNEMITKNYLLDKSSEEEKISLLTKDVTRTVQVVVDIYSRYLFESNVFKARNNSTPDAEEFCQMMIDAQKKAYL